MTVAPAVSDARRGNPAPGTPEGGALSSLPGLAATARRQPAAPGLRRGAHQAGPLPDSPNAPQSAPGRADVVPLLARPRREPRAVHRAGNTPERNIARDAASQSAGPWLTFCKCGKGNACAI